MPPGLLTTKALLFLAKLIGESVLYKVLQDEMYFRLATQTYFCGVVFFVLVQASSGHPGPSVFFSRLLSLKLTFLSLDDLLDCPGVLIDL